MRITWVNVSKSIFESHKPGNVVNVKHFANVTKFANIATLQCNALQTLQSDANIVSFVIHTDTNFPPLADDDGNLVIR